MTALDGYTATAILTALTGVAWTARHLLRTGATVADMQAAGPDLNPHVPPAPDNRQGTDAEALWTCRRSWNADQQAGLDRLRNAIEQQQREEGQQ